MTCDSCAEKSKVVIPEWNLTLCLVHLCFVSLALELEWHD